MGEGSVITAADGSYEHTTSLRSTTDFRATVASSQACAGAQSSDLTVIAKVKVSARARDKTVSQGGLVYITGSVTPKHKGTKVMLQQKTGSRWADVALKEFNAKSKFQFSFNADWKGKRVFRVRWLGGDKDHASGVSKKLVVTAK